MVAHVGDGATGVIVGGTIGGGSGSASDGVVL